MDIEYKFYRKNDVRLLSSLTLLEFAYFDCPPGLVLPLKKPDAFALYFATGGEGVYTLSGDKYPVTGGDIFAVFPGTDIKCRADDEDPWTLCTITFDGLDARLLLNVAGFQPKEPLRNVEDIAEQIGQVIGGINQFKTNDIFSSVMSTTFLYSLFSLLIKTASWDQSKFPPGWTVTIHFQKALKYIEDNYSKPITVDDVADHISVSQSRLYQLFKQQIFKSPQQFLTEYRLSRGLDLLEKRAGSIKEIAQAVGIEDAQYFSRLFKQYTGRSPSEHIRILHEGRKIP